MRIARFTRDDDISYGFVEGEPGDERLHVITGDPLYTALKPTGVVVGMDEVRLLSPVIPRSKVVGVGRNYRDHAREMGHDVPTAPLLFLVPNTAVVGPDDPIVLPSFSQEVDYEGELAVVIGRICKDVPRERVSEVVYGYTCANDVTARDAQRGDGQWARAKGFDSSCPLGPWIATDLDTADLALRTRLDGELVQDGRTSDMVFDVADLVAAVTAAFTLLPGDVILTGTPAGVGRVEAGQRVEVDVEGIGVLGNPVVAR